ncbi:DUF397 domain-containing protein [Peterkaempfera bronchialis]|uniref:DUF397 domain-containing protein n=1 Tax=Peterkaempfera bronchialis TaxID=2126346 RepID=A0A345SZ30_9ACTN|nr:DUF397 domain-containing protein [Peterkaempfera bronchialis]AXI78985.1 DUF397 domain-containing protein [Peterkaempfera bronchialis]
MSTFPDLSTTTWVKSSYSNGNEGECIEVAPGPLVVGTHSGEGTRALKPA